jgi:undecaprenyl-diphosphatase
VITGIYTVLVCTVNKAPIGPEGTVVGFSAINGTFRDVISADGPNMFFDKVTDLIMVFAFLAAGSFVVLGVIQLIKRKNLFKVDKAILALAVVYIVVIVLYVAFDKLAVNYRPFIMPDEVKPEASFPSTHTLLICTIFCTAMVAWNRVFEDKKTLRSILQIAATVFMVIGVAGRIIAGVHWITDIVAGLLFSATLTAAYVAALDNLEA